MVIRGDDEAYRSAMRPHASLASQEHEAAAGKRYIEQGRREMTGR